jgi:hypothetical protein
MRRLILLTAFLLIPAAVLAGADLSARTVSQAGVTIEVTPKALGTQAWTFDVVLTTHSEDLKDDLAKSAGLVLDGGQPLVPIAWEGSPPGGHHRKGVLRFKPPAAQPVEIELRIARPGEAAPRSYRWKLR